MMPVVLLGGIYSGATTPTEAAALAAAYALVISVVLYRSVSFAEFYASLLSSARTSASIGMLIAGALVYNYVVTVENIPDELRLLLTGWELSPAGFLILVNLLLLLPGGAPVGKIGRAKVRTPGTNAQLVCRLLLEKK